MVAVPKFSIIAVDYEHHVPRTGMRQGLLSLAAQEFQDFELIIIHDGPKNVPYEEEFDFSVFKNPPIFLNTSERMNNWGHSSRDLGMRNATGEYFFHFNIDNIMYPDCLEEIKNKIEETNSKVIIFTIKHHKIDGGANPFRGIPPYYCNIDAMQLVAHRDVWSKIGYWYDTHEQGDGALYQRIGEEFSWVNIEKILGENF